MNTKTLIIIYYIVTNLLGLGLMASDKIRAMEHRFRIPESVLLLISLIGGAFGAMIGMFLFHHKTRKMLFRVGIPLMLLVHVVSWAVLLLSASSVVFL